jgi:hypothetical protein
MNIKIETTHKNLSWVVYIFPCIHFKLLIFFLPTPSLLQSL